MSVPHARAPVVADTLALVRANGLTFLRADGLAMLTMRYFTA